MFVNSRGTFAVSVFIFTFHKKHFPIIIITLSFSSTRNNIICCSPYLQDPQNIKLVVPNSLDYPRFRLLSQNVCTPFTLEVKPVSLALTLRALAQLVTICRCDLNLKRSVPNRSQKSQKRKPK